MNARRESTCSIATLHDMYASGAGLSTIAQAFVPRNSALVGNSDYFSPTAQVHVPTPITTTVAQRRRIELLQQTGWFDTCVNHSNGVCGNGPTVITTTGEALRPTFISNGQNEMAACAALPGCNVQIFAPPTGMGMMPGENEEFSAVDVTPMQT